MNSPEPNGIKFKDDAGNELMLVEEGPHAGWVAQKHPDGQYVTKQEATDQDLRSLQMLLKRRRMYEYEEGSIRVAARLQDEEERVKQYLDEQNPFE